jgi:hypothetical protein
MSQTSFLDAIATILSAASAIIGDQPDLVEITVKRLGEYALDAISFVGHMAYDHPNEFVIAVFTAVLAIATIVLAIATIKLWRATNSLWETGEHQLKHLEQTAERQLRAYLAIADAFIKLVDNDTAIETTIMLRNSGQTPGYNFRTTTQVEIKAPPAMGSPYTVGALTPPWARSIIGPNTSHTIGPIRLVFHPGELEAIRNGSRTIFVLGRADYVDAFGADRHFIFRALNGRELVNTDVATGRINWRGWAIMPSNEGYDAN